MMKTTQDVRYSADGPKTTTTEAIALPLWLHVEKPTYQIATREARNVVEHLQAELRSFTAKGGELKMGDLGKPQVQKTSSLILEQQSNEDVRLQLEFFLVLTLEPGQFWDRAEVIAQAIDFAQRFCVKPRDKRITLHMKTARFMDECMKMQQPDGITAVSSQG